MNSSSTTASSLIEPDVLYAQSEVPLLIDTRVFEYYEEEHLPDAMNLNTYDRFVRSTSPIGLRRFQREIAQYYGQAGVSKSRAIVVYDDWVSMRAARECWLLQYIGHPDVRILHGGIQAWKVSGGPVSTEAPQALAPETFEAESQDDIIINVKDILAKISQPHVTMLDVRSIEEYSGMSGLPCCQRQGRIPGAIQIEWTEFLNQATGYYKSPHEIQSLLQRYGIDPNNEIFTYCHRGARAASVYYALRNAGLTNVKNFIGSWHEWGARYDLPIESGAS